MKAFAVLALVAFAATSATHRRSEQLRWHGDNVPLREVVTEKEYQPKTEYLYEYNGQLMTGLPGSSEQHSATRVQALVKLIFKTEEEAFLKIETIRFGYFNEKVANPRRINTFDMFEQVPIEDELKTLLELPIKFRYESGMISSLTFDDKEQPWSANIKRAVLNMLQANVEKKGSKTVETLSQKYDQSDLSIEEGDTRSKLFDFFTTMERTIEGECEVAYTMTSLPAWDGLIREPQNIVNITKTINFDKCTLRPDIRYNYRMQQRLCPQCTTEKGNINHQQMLNTERALRASTIVRINATMSDDRRRLLVETACQESQYTFAPLSESDTIIQTYVNTTLRLIKSTRVSQLTQLESSLTKQSDSDMVYTLDWDIIKERFFMHGEQQFLEQTPYSDINDKVGFVRSLMQKLVHYMRESVEEEAPRQFARLVKIMRTINERDINELFEQCVEKKQLDSFTKEEQKKVASVFIDSLALCATKDCVKVLVHKIENKHISPIKAALTIKKLQQTRVISPEMITELYKLTEEKYCKESPLTICQSAYLTVGSLLHGMCTPNKDKLALYMKQDKRELCQRELKQQWVEKLITRFEQCDTDVCRITVLKCIGNAGIDVAYYKLEQIIKNPIKYPLQLRVEALFATRLLVPHMPRKVERLVMPLYMNKQENSYIRMVAFHKLMLCKPEKFILDQITRSLHNENNRQVASFVYTSLQTYANSTDPCEQKLAADLKLSLHHARYLPVKSWLLRSKMIRAQYQNVHDHRRMSAQLHSIFSNSSIVPRHVAVHLKMFMGAQLHGVDLTPYMLTVGMTQSHIDTYLRQFVNAYSHNFQDVRSTIEDMAAGRWSKEQTSPKFRKELNDVYDELSVESRESQSAEEESSRAIAILYMRFMQQDYGFLPLTKEVLPEQIADIFSENDVSASKFVKRVQQLLSRGGDFALPFDVSTATMLPELSHKIPTTIGMPLQVSTKTPVVAQARGNLIIKYNNELNKFEVTLNDVKPSFVLTMTCKVEMWSPIVNTGLKWIAQTKLYAPFTGKLEVATVPQPQIKFVWQPEQKEYELVRVQTRPSTTVLVWPKVLSQWQEPEEKTIIGEQWPRVYNVRKVYGEKSLGIRFDMHTQWHRTPQHHVPGTPAYFFAGPNTFSLRLSPGEHMPREVEVVLTGKLFEKMSSASMSPKFEKYFEGSDEFLNERSESSSEESRERQIKQREHFDKYYKEFETVEPTSHQIKLLIQGNGAGIERKAEMTVDCHVESQSGKAAKCEIDVKRTPIQEIETSEWQLKSTVEFLYPQMPRSIRDITGEKKFMMRIKTNWGTERNSADKYIDFKLIGEQSRAMECLVKSSLFGQHYEQQLSKWELEERRSHFSPVAQYEQTKKFGMLDQYKIDIDYSMVPPVLKNVTLKVFNIIKNYYFWQSETNKLIEDQHASFVHANAHEGQIRAQLNIDPKSRRYLNVSVEMPRERVIIKDIPLWTRVGALNMRRLSTPSRSYYGTLVNILADYEPNTCKVRTDRVSTFDEVKYRAPLSTCFTVLAKDCSSREQNKFVVLAKRVSESTEEKEVKIITEDVQLVIKPKKVNSIENVELEYILDGVPKSAQQLRQIVSHKSHVLLRVVEEDANYVRIELPEAGIRVFFDGFAINIKVSPYYRQMLCGMCGQLEQEHYLERCELRTARGLCVSTSSKQQLQELVRSYIHGKSCSNTPSIIQEESRYEAEPLQWESEEERIEHIDEELERPRYERENRPIERTRVIEQGHELCFSKKPVYKCPKYTHAIEWQQKPIKVVYTCIERTSPEAQQYARIAHDDDTVTEVTELPASFTQNEYAPSKCVKTEY